MVLFRFRERKSKKRKVIIDERKKGDHVLLTSTGIRSGRRTKKQLALEARKQLGSLMVPVFLYRGS